MEHQVFQNASFLPSQGQDLPPGDGRSRPGIEGNLTAAEHRFLLRKLAQGQAADSCLQFCQVKGLGQIVISTGIQPFHFICHLAASRENQHRGFPIPLAEGTQYRHAIPAGQVQVQQHQIISFCFQYLQCLFPVIAAVHAVGKTAQALGDGLAQFPFILDHQKPHWSLLLIASCIPLGSVLLYQQEIRFVLTFFS